MWKHCRDEEYLPIVLRNLNDVINALQNKSDVGNHCKQFAPMSAVYCLTKGQVAGIAIGVSMALVVVAVASYVTIKKMKPLFSF